MSRRPSFALLLLPAVLVACRISYEDVDQRGVKA
jgi:hypothetical protein